MSSKANPSTFPLFSSALVYPDTYIHQSWPFSSSWLSLWFSHLKKQTQPLKNKQTSQQNAPLSTLYLYVVLALSLSLPSQASSWKSRPPLADFISSFPHPQQSGFQPLSTHSVVVKVMLTSAVTDPMVFPHASPYLTFLINPFGTRNTPLWNVLFHWLYPCFQLSPTHLCSVVLGLLQNLCPNWTLVFYSNLSYPLLFLIFDNGTVIHQLTQTRNLEVILNFSFFILHIRLFTKLCVFP